MNPDSTTIDFYWRPGCPFCMNLESKLNKLDLPLNKKNIWDSKADAETVRSIADGNGTVPTVVIGKAKMVNPSANEVLQALDAQAPELVPEGVEVPENGAFAKRLNKWLGG